MLTYCFV
jgi:hypothetical protein